MTDKSRLNVVQFIDAYTPAVDGVVTLVRSYADTFNKYFGDCTVVAPYMPGYDGSDSFPLVTFKSYDIPQRPPYRAGIPILDKDFRKDEKIFSEANLFHAHTPFGAGMEALRLSRKYEIPIVATFHSKYYDDFKTATNSGLIARAGVKMVVSFYNKVDAVWTVNEASAKTLREYGFDGEITVIPNGTNTHVPENLPELKAQMAEKFDFGTGDVLLFVGQMIRQKNVALIARAALEYKKLGRPFKLVYVGNGEALDATKKLVEELGLNDDCIFTGRINDRDMLAGIYSNATMFVFPSVYDNAPLVIREAASFGIPSLLIEGSNSAEGVTHNYNGILTDLDEKHIAKAIFDLVSDRELYESVALHAKQTLPKSWEDIMEHVNVEYQKVIDKYKSNKKSGHIA